MAESQNGQTNMSLALRSALALIGSLTDAEQDLFASTLRKDWPNLYTLIQDRGWLTRAYKSGKISVELHESLGRIAEAARAAADLPGDDYNALSSWFAHGNRAELHARHATDAVIGRYRIMPDDIWPQEPNYEDVHDGTLAFRAADDGHTETHLRFGSTWFEWNELYRLLKAL